MHTPNRRTFMQSSGAALTLGSLCSTTPSVGSHASQRDALPMQLYKSLTDEQRHKVCLPIDHPSRKFVSNWWYIHPDYRIPATFNRDQQELIQKIFDSLHSVEHQDAVNQQVQIDQYGRIENAPAVGFFGSPADEDFEFIFTGHHVTRRCNAHTDEGLGFGGNPIFYGHFRDEFRETKDHPGNPYWYQGKIFNQFVQSLDDKQQALGLATSDPRSERPNLVLKKESSGWPGLSCADLNEGQQKQLLETMQGMLAMFREDDARATIQSIQDRSLLDQLHISWYGGRYDIGGDQVWDTWQIEGPEMVWYFRGIPHIHCYFHLKS